MGKMDIEEEKRGVIAGEIMFCKFDQLLLTFVCETMSNWNYDSAAWRMESEGLRLNGICE